MPFKIQSAMEGLFQRCKWWDRMGTAKLKTGLILGQETELVPKHLPSTAPSAEGTWATE